MKVVTSKDRIIPVTYSMLNPEKTIVNDYHIYFAWALTRIGEGKGPDWEPDYTEAGLAHIRAVDRLPYWMEKAREWYNTTPEARG